MNSFVTVLLAVVATATVSNADTCPQFWTLFKGSCYRYFGERVTWAEAEAWCQEDFTTQGQAHLVSVHNLEESNFVYTMFRSNAGDTPDWVHDRVNRNPFYGIWLGLHQAVSDGPWLWTDGSSTNFDNWRTGEPNNSFYGEDDEDCVQIWRTSDASDTQQTSWNDIYCEVDLPFICKVPANK